MSGFWKKAAAAVAVKKIVDRVQEARQPKRSFISKMSPAMIVAGIGGAAFWAFKNGKLDPVVEQAKSLTGGSESNGSYPAAAGTEPTSTSMGAASTTSTI